MLFVDETDHDARGQLAGEQLLVTAIDIIFRHLKTLAHDAFYGIFGGGSFEILCVQEEHRRRQLHFAHKQQGVRHNDFGVCGAHQTEVVVTSDQFNLYIHLVQKDQRWVESCQN